MGDYTRRDVVGTLALAGLSVAAGFKASAEPAPTSAIPETVAYVEGEPAAAARKAVALAGGILGIVPKGAVVVIKPSMGFSTAPEIGASTSPAVVAETARMCMEAGASRVIVIDHPVHRPEVCLKITGIGDACSKIPGVFAAATTDGGMFGEVPVPRGVQLKKTAVLKDLLKPGVVHINVATAKSHGSAGVSLCIKNLMGAILEREPFHIRHNLHQAIADLATAIKCDFCIIDASRALIDGGPAGPGKLEHPKAVIAGKNIVAVDAVGVTVAKWYGKAVKPMDIKHIMLSEKHGLGPADLSRIKIIREKA